MMDMDYGCCNALNNPQKSALNMNIACNVQLVDTIRYTNFNKMRVFRDTSAATEHFLQLNIL